MLWFYHTCLTVWGQATKSAMNPMPSLYEQTLKRLDQKPIKSHHFKIQQKYNWLSFDNFLNLSFLKLIFKCVNGLAPKLVSQLIWKYSSKGATTRSAISGDCKPAKRKTAFGKSAFSVKGPQIWNTLPSEIKTLTDYKVCNNRARARICQNISPTGRTNSK